MGSKFYRVMLLAAGLIVAGACLGSAPPGITISSTVLTSTQSAPAATLTASPTVFAHPTVTPTPSMPGIAGTLLFLSDPAHVDYRAAYQADRMLWKRDLATGIETQITVLPGNTTFDASTNPPTVHIVGKTKPEIDGVKIVFMPLPEPCAAAPELCAGFQFSPDDRYVGYSALVDPNGAWKATGFEARVVDAATGEQVFSTKGGFWGWLGSDSIQVNSWYTEGAATKKVNILTGEEMQLGITGGGTGAGAPDKRAFVTGTGAFMRHETGFWMLDLDTGIRSVPHAHGESDAGYLNGPSTGRYGNYCWASDSSAVLYNWQSFTYWTPDPKVSYLGTITAGPTQLWLMDRAGHERLLLSDPSTNYEIDNRCQWRGDILRITIGTYMPSAFPIDTLGDLPSGFGTPTATPTCGPSGLGCAPQPEGMDWRTGELSEWVDMTPTAIPARDTPPLAAEPVYTDPVFRSSIYMQANGDGLWFVPASGKPVLLVQWKPFLYIPPPLRTSVGG